jgi:hypothetical protein
VRVGATPGMRTRLEATPNGWDSVQGGETDRWTHSIKVSDFI